MYYDYIYEIKNNFYDKHHSEEQRKKISESNKGQIPWNIGKHWHTNGTKNTCAYECPEGF